MQVSLFAELFNEMLVRDFGYCIYKALLACPEKVHDDRKLDDDRKKGSDKKTDGKKKDEKKSDKDNADEHHRDSVEVKKETSEDKTGDDEVKTMTKVLIRSFTVCYISLLDMYLPVSVWNMIFLHCSCALCQH